MRRRQTASFGVHIRTQFMADYAAARPSRGRLARSRAGFRKTSAGRSSGPALTPSCDASTALGATHSMTRARTYIPGSRIPFGFGKAARGVTAPEFGRSVTPVNSKRPVAILSRLQAGLAGRLLMLAGRPYQLVRDPVGLRRRPAIAPYRSAPAGAAPTAACAFMALADLRRSTACRNRYAQGDGDAQRPPWRSGGSSRE